MNARALVAALALGAALSCGDSPEDELFGSAGGSSGASGAAGSCAAGCAGSSTGGAAAGAGGEGGGGTAGAAGAAGQAGESGSAGHAADGGAAGSGGSGGAPTPGIIRCGGGICQTSFQICCTCPNCTIPYPTQCFPQITGCTGTGKLMTCDDAADCNGGVCCAHFQPPNYTFTGATCESSCPDEGNAQLCAIDGECPPERACKPLASLPGFRACQPK
jgi:hypothetical protein